MTEQERKLVIEYLKDEPLRFRCASEYKDAELEQVLKVTYNTYGFKFYAISHAWKAVVIELKKEAYRRWINSIIRIRRLWQ